MVGRGEARGRDHWGGVHSVLARVWGTHAATAVDAGSMGLERSWLQQWELQRQLGSRHRRG